MGGKGGQDAGDGGAQAAAIQGEYASDAARDATYADRPNMYNPFGSTEYGTSSYIDPSSGEEVTSWSQYNTLSPEAQNQLDQQMQRVYDQTGYQYDMLNQAPVNVSQFGNTDMGNYQPINMPWVDTGQGNIQQFGDVDMSQYGQQNLGTTNTGQGDLGQFGQMDMSPYGRQNPGMYQEGSLDQFGQMDMSGYGQTGAGIYGQGDISGFDPADPTSFRGLEYDPTEIRNQAQDASMNYANSRLDPRMQQAREATDVRLRNQGLQPGDQAYDAQMDTYNREKNDAYNTAAWTSFGEGRAEAGQMFDQQLQHGQFDNNWEQQQFQNEFGQQQADIGNYLQNFGQNQAGFYQGQGQMMQDRNEAFNRDFSNRGQDMQAYLQNQAQNQQGFYEGQGQNLQDAQQGFERDYTNRQGDISNYLQNRQQDMSGYLAGRQLDTGNQLQNAQQAYGRERGNIDSNAANYMQNRGQDMQGYLDSSQLNSNNLFTDQQNQFNMEQQARQNATAQYLAGREQTRNEYATVDPNQTLGTIYNAFGG